MGSRSWLEWVDIKLSNFTIIYHLKASFPNFYQTFELSWYAKSLKYYYLFESLIDLNSMSISGFWFQLFMSSGILLHLSSYLAVLFHLQSCLHHAKNIGNLMILLRFVRIWTGRWHWICLCRFGVHWQIWLFLEVKMIVIYHASKAWVKFYPFRILNLFVRFYFFYLIYHFSIPNFFYY